MLRYCALSSCSSTRTSCYATVRSLALPHICHDLDHDDDFGDEDDDDDQDDDDDHDHDHDEHDEILKLILMLKLETMLVMKSFVIGPFHFPPMNESGCVHVCIIARIDWLAGGICLVFCEL